MNDLIDAMQWPAMVVTAAASWLVVLQVCLAAMNVRGMLKAPASG